MIDHLDQLDEQILNFYSGNSFIASPQVMPSVNVNIRGYQAFWKPANRYETFCLLAAGCVTDNWFDQLCAGVIGMDRCQGYFEDWKTPRD